MTTNWCADIARMHDRFETKKQYFDGNVLRFRQKFLEEEVRELDEAILNNDPEGVVDAFIDICVIAIGTLNLADIDALKAWDQVFSANMSKKPGINPTRPDSRGFDLVKPEGWIPPNHEGNTGKITLAVQGIIARMDKTGIDHSEKGRVPSHIKIMDEFREFSFSKNHDYNDDEDPEFYHARYYPDGISNIVYEISKKVKRIRRGLKHILNGDEPVTEGLEDSFRDINIYAAIATAYLRGKLEGQSEDRNMFNQEIVP